MGIRSGALGRSSLFRSFLFFGFFFRSFFLVLLSLCGFCPPAPRPSMILSPQLLQTFRKISISLFKCSHLTSVFTVGDGGKAGARRCSWKLSAAPAGWWPGTSECPFGLAAPPPSRPSSDSLSRGQLPLAAGWAHMLRVCHGLPSPWPVRLQAQDLITSPPPAPRGKALWLSAHSSGPALLL